MKRRGLCGQPKPSEKFGKNGRNGRNGKTARAGAGAGSAWASICAACWLALAPAAASAEPNGAPCGADRFEIATLSESVVREVPNDEVTIVLTALETDKDRRASADAAAKAANAVTALAKSYPEGRLTLASRSTSPIYDWDETKKRNKREPSAWESRVELTFKSSDAQRAFEFADRAQDSVSVSGVSFGLSDKSKERIKKGMLQELTAAFRAKAKALAEGFGFAGYRIVEVNLSESFAAGSRPRLYGAPAAMARTGGGASMDVDESMTGLRSVSMSMSGSVQFRR